MFQMAALLGMTGTTEADWWFQDEKHFARRAPYIRSLFGAGILDAPVIPMVAVHVRRGDYIAKDWYYTDLSQTDYYERAAKIFAGEEFFLFSDDIPWCRQNFLGADRFDESTNPIDSLNLMARCRGHIIANSTFSWWGAWLSPHAGKVVAPKEDRWQVNGQICCHVPSRWIQVDPTPLSAGHPAPGKPW